MNPAKPLKIVHLTVYRDLPAGIRKQIKWEQSASARLTGAEWTSLAVHGGEPVESFERRIPAPFRAMFLRNLYGWLVVRRLAKNHDVVLLRHMPFDPFALIFAPFIKNRVGVHHSREVEELPLISPGLSGRLAGWLEGITGWVAVRCAKGILGVTNEIARFQVATRASGKPSGLFANGIDLDTVGEVEDRRSDSSTQVVFICNTFSEWHGLDRLVDAVRNASDIPEGLFIHLIGQLSEAQQRLIAELGPRAQLFRIHGFLKTEAYRALLAQADAGLGSLAMDRQNLREGATLKVREMLGMGLPVYSGHVDTALDETFPYYRLVPNVDIAGLDSFAREMKTHSRSDVRSASAPFIEKSAMMQRTADWLRSLFNESE